MALNQSLLGKRLKDARVNRGLTQDQVAESIGVSRTSLVQIEAGNRGINTLELAELARLYNRHVSDFFLEDEEPGRDPFLILHRVDPAFLEDSDLQDAISNVIAVCQAAADLKEVLSITGTSIPLSYSLSSPMSTMDAVQQGSSVARQERDRLGLGNNPVYDVAKLISAQGICAATADFPTEISGLYLQHPSTGTVIVVNEKHKDTRRRFSLAHEYGHALMDRGSSATATISTSSNRDELVEVRANAFAAAFLLPDEGVRRFIAALRKGLPSRIEEEIYDIQAEEKKEPIKAKSREIAEFQKVTYQDVVLLKMYFGVSYQAACYRLKSIGVINRAELDELLGKESLAREISKLLDLREREDEETLKLQVVDLAIEAYRREAISQGKLRDIGSVIGVSGPELIKLAEAA